MTILVQQQLREATERLIAEGENCWPATVERFTELANPAAILALLDEVDAANANHENAVAHMQSVCAERDQLKAENADLRRDAEQYRWLRKCSHFDMPQHRVYCGAYGPALDEDIDQAMTKEQP